MGPVADMVSRSGLQVTHVIVGMVIDTTGVVTKMPGYDFKVIILVLTKDENVLSRHEIIISSDGISLAEFRMNYIGRYVLTVRDEQGRATPLVKGRCSWQEKR